jgi:hypothetical protein
MKDLVKTYFPSSCYFLSVKSWYSLQKLPFKPLQSLFHYDPRQSFTPLFIKRYIIAYYSAVWFIPENFTCERSGESNFRCKNRNPVFEKRLVTLLSYPGPQDTYLTLLYASRQVHILFQSASVEIINKMRPCNLLFQNLLKAQHVLSSIPLIIRSSKLCISYHHIISYLITYIISIISYISYIKHIISYQSHHISYQSYLISYHISNISYHIISYHIISYHIISYHIISYQSYIISIISYIISYIKHIISYQSYQSYHIIYQTYHIL